MDISSPLNQYNFQETPLGEAYAIGTYNVVPMSPTIGLIEWVKDTQTLKAFIDRVARDKFKSQHLLEEVRQRKIYAILDQRSESIATLATKLPNMSTEKVNFYSSSRY